MLFLDMEVEKMPFFKNARVRPIGFLLSLIAYSFLDIDSRFYRDSSGQYYYNGKRKDLVKLLRMTSHCSLGNTFYLRFEGESNIHAHLSGDILWFDRKALIHTIDIGKIELLFGPELFSALVVILSDTRVSRLLKAGDWEVINHIARNIDILPGPSRVSDSIFQDPNEAISVIMKHCSCPCSTEGA